MYRCETHIESIFSTKHLILLIKYILWTSSGTRNSCGCQLHSMEPGYTKATINEIAVVLLKVQCDNSRNWFFLKLQGCLFTVSWTLWFWWSGLKFLAFPSICSSYILNDELMGMLTPTTDRRFVRTKLLRFWVMMSSEYLGEGGRVRMRVKQFEIDHH